MLKHEGEAHTTRHIPQRVTHELWALAGGRCQFRGCNKLLYRSPVTQERVNNAQRAHIYSYSADGARGRGLYARRTKGLNSTKNLMLMCHGCHTLIDRDILGEKYSAQLLQEWKREHEIRIERNTGVHPKRMSHIVLYGSRINEQDSPLQEDEATGAIFPGRYPAENHAINLSMKLEHEDNTPEFWVTEATHLRNSFDRLVARPILEGRASHFSLFALAGIPLLVLLGSLFTDKRAVDVYQPRRNPRGWRWLRRATQKFRFTLNRPKQARGEPVLVFSLSGKIDYARVHAALGRQAAIWELTIDEPYNDFLRSRDQLALFCTSVRQLMEEINRRHGRKPVHIFPAMPVACAIELGRLRMPQSDPPWILYNQNNKLGGFTTALTIGDQTP
ncbi:MAG TPA: SAVED domain-containing protein [Opitutaceae bacterium]|nr:SAVED domain-containing protein [Opitutaceae bacterium]